MIARTLFDAEHGAFCESVHYFIDAGILSHHERRGDQGYVSRIIWEKAAAADYHCASMPRTYDGAGVDIRYNTMLIEEIARAGATGLGFGLHSEAVVPYLLYYDSEALKWHYLPKLTSVEVIGVIVMTEPGTGPDLQGVRITATRSRDGNHYVLNDSKIFITNGWHADVVIVMACTTPEGGTEGMSLSIVDTGMEGFNKGKHLKKVGMRAQNTVELFFDNVRLPTDNLLGEEHRGFAYLVQELPWKRPQIVIAAIASAEGVFEWMLRYVCERQTFGRSILDFQTARHALAELRTEVQIDRVFVGQCIALRLAGKLGATIVSMARYWTADL